MDQTNSKKLSVGAIWVKTSKSGNKYISVAVEINGERINLVGFKNNYKQEGSNQPDYRLFFSEEKQSTMPQRYPAESYNKATVVQQMTEDRLKEEDVPF